MRCESDSAVGVVAAYGTVSLMVFVIRRPVIQCQSNNVFFLVWAARAYMKTRSRTLASSSSCPYHITALHKMFNVRSTSARPIDLTCQKYFVGISECGGAEATVEDINGRQAAGTGQASAVSRLWVKKAKNCFFLRSRDCFPMYGMT